MVAALKKLTGGDVAGRFAAWWNGEDYSPEPDDETASDDAAKIASKAKKTKGKKKTPKPEAVPDAGTKVSVRPKLSSTASRIAALEAIWGEGRFGPAGAELYNRITANLPEGASGEERKFGVLNTDPAWVNQFVAELGSVPVIAEWRSSCANRYHETHPDFDLITGDLDRPPFEPGSMDLIFSHDAFAYADHKSGLAVRIHRSLAPGGQWIVLDTVRGSATGNLAPAFASAWAEPQLCNPDEIQEICESVGFEVAREEEDVTGDVVQACKTSLDRFAAELESRMADKLPAVNKIAFMQELGWETESWKWRQRAYAGDLIHARIWKFRKPEA